MPLPPSPYPGPSSSLRQLSFRVSHEDHAYFSSLVTYRYGIIDSVCATIFHALVAECRAAGLDPTRADSRAFHAGHPTCDQIDAIVDSIISRIANRGVAGEVLPRDDERGTGGLGETNDGSAKQCADASGDVAQRKLGCTKGEGEEEGLGVLGDGVPEGLDGLGLLEMLKKKGIL